MATDQNDPKPDQKANSEKSTSIPAEKANPQPAPQQQRQGQSQSQGQDRRRYRGRGWDGNRNRDVLYEKAVKLAQSGRVEFLDNGVYNVIGDHGTYTVALDHTGKLSCNCPGFMQKGACSHVTAVSIVTRNRRRR